MRKTIDTKRALELRETGLKWRIIGIILAIEEDRDQPYHENSVKGAVARDQSVRAQIKCEPTGRDL